MIPVIRIKQNSFVQKLGVVTALLVSVLLISCGGGGADSGGDRLNPPPAVNSVTYKPSAPKEGDEVEFSADCAGSGSLTYEWNFGDGTPAALTHANSTTHTYRDSGNKNFVLTCIDDIQQRTSRSVTVSIQSKIFVPDESVKNRTCGKGLVGSGWCAQNPLPTSSNLESAVAIDRDTIWAVGDNGTIIKIRANVSGNGISWDVQNSGASANLQAIAKWDNNTAWTVGEGGVILKTTDGGVTWENQTTSGVFHLFSVAIKDSNTAWASGVGGSDEHGVLLMTTNGGKNWVKQTGFNALPKIELVSKWYSIAVDQETGVVRVTGNNSAILKGANNSSGQWQWEWEQQPLEAPNPVKILFSIAIPSNDSGWAVSEDGVTLKKTKDTPWAFEPESSEHLHAVTALDTDGDKVADTAWAVGQYGTILKKRGTQRWNPPTEPPKIRYYLRSVVAYDANTIWTVGNNGTVARSIDGGEHWKVLTSGWTTQNSGHDDNSLNSVAAVDENTAWATGWNLTDGIVMSTTDGGVTWTRKQLPPSKSTIPLNGVAAIDANIAWVVGNSGTILKTTTGGTSWQSQTAGTTADLRSIKVVDANNAWVVGSGGTILKTSNGGATWEPQVQPDTTNWTTNTLNFISALSDGTAFAVGDLGTVLKTTKDDNGKWTPVTNLELTQVNDPTNGLRDPHLYAVVVLDAKTVWLVGEGSNIRKTTNGGESWPKQQTNEATNFYTMAAINGQIAWAAGRAANGQAAGIFKTNDAGETWTKYPSAIGVWGHVKSIAGVNSNKAWAVGTSGYIGKTVTGGE